MEILLYMSENVDTWYRIVVLFVPWEDLSKINLTTLLFVLRAMLSPPPQKKEIKQSKKKTKQTKKTNKIKPKKRTVYWG